MIENPMVLPEVEYKKGRSDEEWAEREDRDYQDRVFEEMEEE